MLFFPRRLGRISGMEQHERQQRAHAGKLRWRQLYSEAELFKAALKTCAKSLFQ